MTREPASGGDSRLAPGTAGVEQAAVTRRYNRLARVYDLCSAPMELGGVRRLRRRLVSQARGRTLEVGVGTGKNLPYYPPSVDLTAVDASPAMLARAKSRALRLQRSATFELGDVTHLPYPDDTFDTTAAACLFCSVADPVAGLAELGRVTKGGGRVLLLEHVRPTGRLAGRFADLVTPITRRLFGFHANRRTEGNVAAAGLDVTDIRRDGIWRHIEARPPDARRQRRR